MCIYICICTCICICISISIYRGILGKALALFAEQSTSLSTATLSRSVYPPALAGGRTTPMEGEQGLRLKVLCVPK